MKHRLLLLLVMAATALVAAQAAFADDHARRDRTSNVVFVQTNEPTEEVEADGGTVDLTQSTD